ncbi:MAG: phage terminase large subunit [Cyanobacteriota bacterium]|jgi:predicted phage terminase large subunit-like protein
MPVRATDVSSRLALLELERDALVSKELQGPYTGSLEDYIRAVCPSFPWSPHTHRLVALAQRVADGEIRRLMVELPPRHFKSTIFSIFLPGYFLRRYPNRSVGIGCHTATLAEGFSQDARDYFTASGGALSPTSGGVKKWGTSGIGGLWTAGVGGGTGNPGDLIVVDDPIKSREMAESAAWRRQVHSWWDSVLATREEPGNAVVIVHTRWHSNDLIGYLLTKNEELEKEGLEAQCEPWHVVSMPIEAVAANNIKPLPRTVTRERDDRQPGQALDPTRFDESWIERKRANTPSRDWEALYQQAPTEAGGTIVSKDWFRFYVLPGQPQEPGDVVLPVAGIRRIASLDSTFKDSAGSDMVGLGMWLQTQEGLYRLAQVNRRMGFVETLETLRGLQSAWQFNTLLVEDKANGPAVIDTLKREAKGYVVHAVNPLGGKVARAEAAAVTLQQGRVFLPRHAPWLSEYMGQLLAFPSGTFDDLVDETTQVINFVAGTGPMTVHAVTWGHGASDDLPEPSTSLGWSERHLAGLAGPDPDGLF